MTPGTLDAVVQIEVGDEGVDGGQLPSGVRLTRDPSGWALDVDLDGPLGPERSAEERLTRLVGEAASLVAARGGGPLTWWVARPGPEHERVAATAGLTPGRVLYQMRRELPVDSEHRRGAEPLATRAFRPGLDEPAWLEVNNRAFSWHPEQGGWTLQTLREREAEPWFDPAGFLLHESGGTVDGFCWTKVHRDTEPVLGEIYVIAADPGAAGGGFGRRLVLAGLDHLTAQGITVGMLYTDATNERAVKLYVDLGFVVYQLSQAFTGSVPPSVEAGG